MVKYTYVTEKVEDGRRRKRTGRSGCRYPHSVTDCFAGVAENTTPFSGGELMSLIPKSIDDERRRLEKLHAIESQLKAAELEKRKAHSLYNKERYSLLKSLNICVSCGQFDAYPGHVFCDFCRAKQQERDYIRYRNRSPEYQDRQNELRKKRRRGFKAAGLCTDCGRKPVEGKAYCIECLLKRKRAKRKYEEKSKAERHERGLIPEYRLENHLCYLCGVKLPEGNKHGKVCDECSKKLLERRNKGDFTYWKGLNHLVFNTKKGNKQS